MPWSLALPPSFSKPLSKNTINTDSSLYHQTLYFLHTIIWKNSWKTNDQLLVTVLCYDYKCYRVPSLFWFFIIFLPPYIYIFSFLISTCEFSCSLCILVSSTSFFSCHAFYSLSYTIRFYFFYVMSFTFHTSFSSSTLRGFLSYSTIFPS